MNKAVEVGNKSNLTRAVKNYTDSVVHQAGQAVAELLQDRIVKTRNSPFISLDCYLFCVICRFMIGC